MRDSLPAFAICGWSGSGKTTLIEKIIPALGKKGLKVVVVKHDSHGIDVDHPGKDSDRFFKAGADVLLRGPKEQLLRLHQASHQGLTRVLDVLAQQYDLVLVEGHKDTPLPKIWLLGEDELAPPTQVDQILTVLSRDAERPTIVLDILEKWLAEQWTKPPVFGCALIGGASSRMGKAKHLLRRDGRTWLEHTVELLGQVCERVVISGSGEIPDELVDHPRLADTPDAQGPMAGLLSAMRWASQVSWLVAACDLPQMSLDALHWLLASRAPGVWATLPNLAGVSGVEPLLAHYDFRSRLLLEHLVAQGEFSISSLATHPKVISPAPPDKLSPAWHNINTLDELNLFDSKMQG